LCYTSRKKCFYLWQEINLGALDEKFGQVFLAVSCSLFPLPCPKGLVEVKEAEAVKGKLDEIFSENFGRSLHKVSKLSYSKNTSTIGDK